MRAGNSSLSHSTAGASKPSSCPTTPASASGPATRLRDHAPALADAGIRRINVSLDSLDAETFRYVTQGVWQQVEIRPFRVAAERAGKPGDKQD